MSFMSTSDDDADFASGVSRGVMEGRHVSMDEPVRSKGSRPLPLKALNHVSRVVRDVNKSARWYRDLLGFTLVKRPSSFDFEGAWLWHPSFHIGMHLIAGEPLPRASNIEPKREHLSFQTDSLEAVEEQLTEIGCPYRKALVRESGIMVTQIFFHDPDNNMIEVCNCDLLPVEPLHENSYSTKAVMAVCPSCLTGPSSFPASGSSCESSQDARSNSPFDDRSDYSVSSFAGGFNRASAPCLVDFCLNLGPHAHSAAAQAVACARMNKSCSVSHGLSGVMGKVPSAVIICAQEITSVRCFSNQAQCGIFGYYTYGVDRDLRAILLTLFNGLKRLEYRGYDSAGVAVELVDPYPISSKQVGNTDGATIAEENGVHDGLAPLICKEVGKVVELERLTYETIAKDHVELERMCKNQVAISHTRWATHGAPSTTNSHPHISDKSCAFVVVHNGIITNYKLLKDFLIRHGEVFYSETDTEVIPKLCKFVYERLSERLAFPKLVMEVLKKLEGAYALLIKSTHYPGQLVACKRGSPLILGIKDGSMLRRTSFNRIMDAEEPHWKSTAIECWVASDASAVVEHTKRVIVLENDDVLHLQGGGYGIYNTATGGDVDEAVPRVLLTLQVEVEQIMKGGFEHFMQKEIHEQPESLLQTMRGRVQFQRPAVGNPYHTPRIKLGGLVEPSEAIRHSRRIMFVACGTSFNACLASRQTVEDMCDVPVVLELASDLLDRRCPIYRDDTCVFVSQSGETADTLMALEYAKARGAMCVGLTNTVGSAISRGTHCGIHLNAGYEIGVASTKAYTSQIVAITMMALQLSEDSISKREKRDQIIDELGQLPGKVRSALMLDAAMLELAGQLKDEHSLMFFARGYNYATALEAALKTKEVAQIHSEGILAGEMKHGPLALVDENLPIIVVATRDSMHTKMESVIQQLLARSAKLFILCNEGDESMKAYEQSGCKLIQVPETVECLQPVINIIPLQLLSYHLTILKGLNVDQPRNLAKSVTVSEEH